MEQGVFHLGSDDAIEVGRAAGRPSGSTDRPVNSMFSLKPIVIGTFSVSGTPARVFGLASAVLSLEVAVSSGTSFLSHGRGANLDLGVGRARAADRRRRPGGLSSASSSAPGCLVGEKAPGGQLRECSGPVDPGLVSLLVHLDHTRGCDLLGSLSSLFSTRAGGNGPGKYVFSVGSRW